MIVRSLKLKVLILGVVILLGSLALYLIERLEDSLIDDEVKKGLALRNALCRYLEEEVFSLKSTLYALSKLSLLGDLGDEELSDSLRGLHETREAFVSMSGLIGRDGTILEIYPDEPTLKGKSVAEAPFFKLIKAGPIGLVMDFPLRLGERSFIGLYAPLFDRGRSFRGVLFYLLDPGMMVDNFKRMHEPFGSLWNMSVLRGKDGVVWGDRIMAHLLSDLGKEGKKVIDLGGVKTLVLYRMISVERDEPWYILLYAAQDFLLGKVKYPLAMVKFLVISLAGLFSFVVPLPWGRRKDEARDRALKEVVEELEEPKEHGESGSSVKDSFEEFRKSCPGILIELNDAFEVLRFSGKTDKLPLTAEEMVGKSLKELLPEDELGNLINQRKGEIRLGDRVYFFLMTSLGEGRHLLLGCDFTEKSTIERMLRESWRNFIVGKLLFKAKDFNRFREFLFDFDEAREEKRRADLNGLILEIKDLLGLDRLELDLDERLPLPYVKPSDLKELLLTLILMAYDGRALRIRTSYVRDKAVVSMELCMKGKLKEDSVALTMIEDIVKRCGGGFSFRESSDEEVVLSVEFPIFPTSG